MYIRRLPFACFYRRHFLLNFRFTVLDYLHLPSDFCRKRRKSKTVSLKLNVGLTLKHPVFSVSGDY